MSTQSETGVGEMNKEDATSKVSVLDVEGQAKVRAGSMSIIVGSAQNLETTDETFDLAKELEGCPELPEGAADDYNSWLG